MSMNPVERRNQDRILIIESEPSVSKPLISVLKRGGFSVAHVPACPEMLIKLNELNPAMIIMDETLHGDKDTAACSKLRSLFCAPIILLGRNANDERWLSAVEADPSSSTGVSPVHGVSPVRDGDPTSSTGADFFFSGPLDDSALIASLREILSLRKRESPMPCFTGHHEV